VLLSPHDDQFCDQSTICVQCFSRCVETDAARWHEFRSICGRSKHATGVRRGLILKTAVKQFCFGRLRCSGGRSPLTPQGRANLPDWIDSVLWPLLYLSARRKGGLRSLPEGMLPVAKIEVNTDRRCRGRQLLYSSGISERCVRLHLRHHALWAGGHSTTPFSDICYAEQKPSQDGSLAPLAEKPDTLFIE